MNVKVETTKQAPSATTTNPKPRLIFKCEKCNFTFKGLAPLFWVYLDKDETFGIGKRISIYTIQTPLQHFIEEVSRKGEGIVKKPRFKMYLSK